ncbi:regulator of ribonuclease activity B [Alteromonadaceae bacterium 2753L.S.0a.02]|nr:regulator of ribonuclease activity B [Alteromonadaceae bacterium 2753L.S.0a.02]
MTWPNDADGDVMRRLQNAGFDFSKKYKVDFNIDFDHWPLDKSEVQRILSLYPTAEFINPDEEDRKNGITTGYVLLVFNSEVSYEYVIATQKSLSQEMSVIGGVCESWGVMHG